jgi:hypothetical protein
MVMSTTYTTTTISSTTIKVSVSAKPMTIAEKVWNRLSKADAGSFGGTAALSGTPGSDSPENFF